MRITLEQLKAMSDKELFQNWMGGIFPFDVTSVRCGCMTTHTLSNCENKHEAFSSEVEKVLGESFYVTPETVGILRKHLEELYAIRLFYDHLYDKEETNAVQETKQEKEKVSR